MPPGSWLRGWRVLLLAGIWAAGFPFPLSGSSVSGVVVARQGDRMVPVFRASMAAREAAGSDILAVARTDQEGRFLIVDLPSPRVALSVRKHGYFTSAINGREGNSLVLDCSAPEDCAGVEFELGAAAVISGFVVDELGEPMADLGVRVARQDSSQADLNPDVSGGTTDDRGYFRVSGLKPARYSVRAEGEVRSFFRGHPVESEPVDVEVEEGGDTGGIQITARIPVMRKESYTISGRVSGVDLSREGSHVIRVRELPSAGRRSSSGYAVANSITEDGSFLFKGLQAGRHALAYVHRSPRSSSREHDWQSLGTIEVSGDVSGLVLSPLPPTGFSGTVRFETRGAPRPLQLSLSSDDGEYFAWERVEPPDFRFEVVNLVPGRYQIHISNGRRSNAGFYIKGIRRGDELMPSRELVATEGVVDQFDIVVSDEMARVYGRVKAAIEPGAGRTVRKGAQYQVALSGPNRAIRVTQADQYGRFEFEDIIPGEYRICGWADLERHAVYDDKTWEEAGSAVRRFTVEAGSDVELDLTAAP